MRPDEDMPLLLSIHFLSAGKFARKRHEMATGKERKKGLELEPGLRASTLMITLIYDLISLGLLHNRGFSSSLNKARRNWGSVTAEILVKCLGERGCDTSSLLLIYASDNLRAPKKMSEKKRRENPKPKQCVASLVSHAERHHSSGGCVDG